MIKKILLIFLIFFLSQCGYSSVYKNNPDQNFKILITELSGDQYFNKKLNSELRMYFDNDGDKIFNINIVSNFDTKVISKDAAGKISNFELTINSLFKINDNNKNYEFNFSESVKIKKKDNAFEQKKYENIIKENFAKSIKEKLIFKLNSL